MAKRKKYPKLPNGYGSIKYLGKGRRNPYGVYPPTTEFTLSGSPVTPKALCYVSDWMVGFAVLTSYHAGTWHEGMESAFSPDMAPSSANILIQRILSDYSSLKNSRASAEKGKTFSEIYQEFYNWKFVQDQSRTYSKSTFDATKLAYKHCQPLYEREFASLRHQDLQDIVDACPCKTATKELIIVLFHQIYKFAEIYELVDKDYSSHVRVNVPNDDEHGVPFTNEELAILWAHKSDPVVEFLLIMCYSGYRILAYYQNMTVNLDEGYFCGGVKTASSKNRIVPIHSAIRDLVAARIRRDGGLLTVLPQAFRLRMYSTLAALGIEKHTPHDCRHTFSALCEKYGVNENDRKRMMGHSFGSDITNGIYGHRSLEDLRSEIEKIKIPCC